MTPPVAAVGTTMDLRVDLAHFDPHAHATPLLDPRQMPQHFEKPIDIDPGMTPHGPAVDPAAYTDPILTLPSAVLHPAEDIDPGYSPGRVEYFPDPQPWNPEPHNTGIVPPAMWVPNEFDAGLLYW